MLHCCQLVLFDHDVDKRCRNNDDEIGNDDDDDGWMDVKALKVAIINYIC